MKFLKYGPLKKSPLVLGCPMPYPTLRNKSQNFHFLNKHKDLMFSVVKLLQTVIQTELIMLQVKIKPSKYHPMNLH